MGPCAFTINVFMCMCVHECGCTGVLLELLMECHYILVSSASVLRDWDTAALTPQALSESGPKGHSCYPYIFLSPSFAIHPFPLLDPCHHPCVYYFIFLSLNFLFFHLLFCWDPQQQHCPSMHPKN